MAKAKDDASTDIEKSVKSFIDDMNSEMATWAKARETEIEKAKKAAAKDAGPADDKKSKEKEKPGKAKDDKKDAKKPGTPSVIKKP